MTHFFPDEAKVTAIDEPAGAATTLRTLCMQQPKGMTWRNDRAYVIVESAERTRDHCFVEGQVRGGGLHIDGLVHLPSVGDFQINRISPPKQSAGKGERD